MAAFNTILPLSFAAGINLYLTVLVVGFSVRYGWVPDVPAGLHVFGSAPVLIAAGVLYVIQFFVDKIPLSIICGTFCIRLFGLSARWSS
ncbi:MAG: DUF4126 domain-containing protein [Chloroflexaceae bacterium]|nr:DUF4126 domain-containing protein [Chloroflexaceae bacterium]